MTQPQASSRVNTMRQVAAALSEASQAFGRAGYQLRDPENRSQPGYVPIDVRCGNLSLSAREMFGPTQITKTQRDWTKPFPPPGAAQVMLWSVIDNDWGRFRQAHHQTTNVTGQLKQGLRDILDGGLTRRSDDRGLAGIAADVRLGNARLTAVADILDTLPPQTMRDGTRDTGPQVHDLLAPAGRLTATIDTRYQQMSDARERFGELTAGLAAFTPTRRDEYRSQDDGSEYPELLMKHAEWIGRLSVALATDADRLGPNCGRLSDSLHRLAERAAEIADQWEVFDAAMQPLATPLEATAPTKQGANTVAAEQGAVVRRWLTPPKTDHQLT